MSGRKVPDERCWDEPATEPNGTRVGPRPAGRRGSGARKRPKELPPRSHQRRCKHLHRRLRSGAPSSKDYVTGRGTGLGRGLSTRFQDRGPKSATCPQSIHGGRAGGGGGGRPWPAAPMQFCRAGDPPPTPMQMGCILFAWCRLRPTPVQRPISDPAYRGVPCGRARTGPPTSGGRPLRISSSVGRSSVGWCVAVGSCCGGRSVTSPPRVDSISRSSRASRTAGFRASGSPASPAWSRRWVASMSMPRIRRVHIDGGDPTIAQRMMQPMCIGSGRGGRPCRRQVTVMQPMCIGFRGWFPARRAHEGHRAHENAQRNLDH